MSVGTLILIASFGVAAFSLAWAASNFVVTRLANSKASNASFLARLFPSIAKRAPEWPRQPTHNDLLLDELRMLRTIASEQAALTRQVLYRDRAAWARGRNLDDLRRERLEALYDEAKLWFFEAGARAQRGRSRIELDFRNRNAALYALRAGGFFSHDPRLNEEIATWVSNVFDLEASTRKGKLAPPSAVLFDLEARRPRRIQDDE